MTTTLLSVRGLTVELSTAERSFEAVSDISFDVSRNEVLALVGESGSGKSMTALAIMRLLPEPVAEIVAGKILFGDVDLAGASEARLMGIRGNRIGLIFQEPMTSLNPSIRVGPQVAEVLRLHKGLSAAAARKRVEELFELVRIPDPRRRYDDYPHQMSGGMRQRVVIALALAAEPKLIVADEPTTALDVSIQAQIIMLLKSICKKHGAAVMLITHDMGVIAETCDRVAVMYAGRIAEIGPVHEVINHPSHPYTAGLMEAIPDITLDRERLNQIDGAMPRLNAIPQGCAFNPRCPKVFDRCTQDRPDLLPAGATRAACWLHDATVGVTA